MYESGEMYLETIYVLKNKNGSVRSIDIARELDFSKPSVSRGVGILKKEQYILVDENGYITLTDKGLETAKAIFEKHLFITDFLVKTLGISKELAEEDACKMEHIISDETFRKMKEYLGQN
ncbi:MAG: metal-dependent transcriptional regulator [Coprobacillaceae bacterium]